MNYLYGLVAAALLLLGAGFYGHHVGYASGEAAGTKAVAKAADKQHDAEQSLGVCASALNVTTAATDAAKARAALAQQQAQAVIDGAGKDKAANAAATAVFTGKVAAASKAGDCQSVLEATLCPALSGY